MGFGPKRRSTMNQVKQTASISMGRNFLMVVAWMLDCQFRMIEVLFSQEIGEYRVSAFCIFYTNICFTKPRSGM